MGETLKVREKVKLSRNLALTLQVAAVLALGAALVPILAGPAQALLPSTTVVTDNSPGVDAGGSFIFTATVTGSGLTPTGTATWSVTDPNGDPVSCPDSTLDGSGQATCTVSNAIAGTYPATVTYGGDSNYGSSSGSDTTAEVGKASSTTSVSFSGSATVGSPETVTAAVSPTDNGGTVSFSVTLGGNPVALPAPCTGAGLSLGEATCTFTPTLAGIHTFIASYWGDSSYGSSSGTGSVTVSAVVVPPPPPTPTTITQAAPFSNSTTPAKSASFTNTLATTGNTGAVTFVTTSAPPGSAGGIRVSSSGVVTTTGALSAGTYKASGTDSDSSGDTGIWSFSLTVSATAITQLPPTSGTTTTGKAFTGQLKVTGSHGALSSSQTAPFT